MRLVGNDSAKDGTDDSRLATCCSSPDTIFSSTVLCNVEGSPARTAEPPAVADSASKAKPTTLQPPTIREFHLLFMFCSRLQARETGAEKGCQCRHRQPPPASWNLLVNKRLQRGMIFSPVCSSEICGQACIWLITLSI